MLLEIHVSAREDGDAWDQENNNEGVSVSTSIGDFRPEGEGEKVVILSSR